MYMYIYVYRHIYAYIHIYICLYFYVHESYVPRNELLLSEGFYCLLKNGWAI